MGLEPDLTWWRHGRCVFVGDCKYKRTSDGADVYQLLAYLTGLDLDEGLLVYAAGEDIDRTATIRAAGKRIHVRTVDVARPPADVLAQVRTLAHLVRRLDADAPGAATTAAS